MSLAISRRSALPRLMAVDALACAAVAVVPALSHLITAPLYLFEPMRLVLFGVLLASGRSNALVMAAALPAIATLTSGHPVVPKIFLIQGELLLNVLLFHGLLRRWGRPALAAGASILGAKAAYYLGKFILLQAALLDGTLVSTPWIYQAAVLVTLVTATALVGGRRLTER